METTVTRMMLISESLLVRFGFNIMLAKIFKSGFFIVGKASYVNIALTYGLENGFSVDILPNKEFAGLTLDVAQFDFSKSPDWEEKLLVVLKCALKKNNAVGKKLLIKTKFREISSIQLHRLQQG